MRYTSKHLHPTQKTVSALLPLIESFSWEGDLVLDPFCGSGSTLIAARCLHRHFFGIELDPTYHALAALRTAPPHEARGSLKLTVERRLRAAAPVNKHQIQR